MTNPFIVPQPQPLPEPPKGKKPVGLIIGASAVGVIALMSLAAANGNHSTAAAPSPTVTVTTPASPTTEPTYAEPSDEPTEEPETFSGEENLAWGKKAYLTMNDQSVTLAIGAPKRSNNMFDRNNAEVKVTVCNTSDERLEDVSAEAFGLVMEDSDGGSYDLYGAYRTPEFPTYDYDGKTLRPGKCSTGWVSFDDAWKGKGKVVTMEVGDGTFIWGN